MRHLARDELEPAPRRLVIEQYARAGKEVVALAVVDGNPVPVDLGHPVGTARIERGQLGLRRLAHMPEHLARRRLIEADGLVGHANRFEQPRHTERGHVPGEDGLVPGSGHKGLRREIVDLVRAEIRQRLDKRYLVGQVRLNELDARLDMVDALEILGARPAHHALHFVSLLEQQLRQIRTILAGDAGNQRAARGFLCHATSLSFYAPRYAVSIADSGSGTRRRSGRYLLPW